MVVLTTDREIHFLSQQSSHLELISLVFEALLKPGDNFPLKVGFNLLIARLKKHLANKLLKALTINQLMNQQLLTRKGRNIQNRGIVQQFPLVVGEGPWGRTVEEFYQSQQQVVGLLLVVAGGWFGLLLGQGFLLLAVAAGVVQHLDELLEVDHAQVAFDG